MDVTIAKLKCRTARAALPTRTKPYYVNIARGLQLGYRRNAHHGVWTLRDARGGGDWTRRIAIADDSAESNHETVLDFYEAQTRAHEIAGAGKDGEPVKLNAPAAVGTAIDAYIADLESRGRSTANAKTVKTHLQGDPLFNRVSRCCSARSLRTSARSCASAGSRWPASTGSQASSRAP
jgi:hypothetical protein